MGAAFIIAIFAALLIAWACTDKVIYHGPASVTPSQIVHVSRTHKTVMVVPFQQLNLGSNIIVAEVPNAKAAEVAAEPFVDRTVIVHKRLWGEARVTSIS